MKNNQEKASPKNSKALPDVEVFYDARDGSYWYQVKGRYLQLSGKDLRLHLKARHGLQDNQVVFTEMGWLRETDYPLWYAMENRLIDYAGPLAGHRVGVFTSGGRKFLVTEETPEVWDCEKVKGTGKPVWFIEFIQELLGEQDQWLYFSHWLAFGLRSFLRRDFQPGQVCVFAGPGGCGKSLLQHIITMLFGGRSASPFRYMMGETQFNSDMASAEHWMIEDPASTTDIRTRRLFGAMLKECAVNKNFHIHKKGKDAILLPLFRRTTISCNDEPENLAVIPPFDPSIADKVSLFKCTPVKKALERFLSKDGELDRLALQSHIESELAAIRLWLIRGLGKLSKTLRSSRYGVVAWHHPDLLAELANLSQESRLLSLLDEALFKDWDALDLPYFEGKAYEIEQKLRTGDFKFEAEKILKYSGACGVLLSRLAKSNANRVSSRMLHGYTLWRITNPGESPDKNQMLLGVSPFALDAKIAKPAF